MKLNFRFLAPLILGVLFSFLGNAQNGYNASRVTWSPAVDTVAVTYKPNGTSVRYLDDDLYFKRRGIWTKWTNPVSTGIGGAVTAGFIPYATGVNTLANSTATFSGTKITVVPSAASAGLNIGTTATTSGFVNGDLYTGGSNSINFRISGGSQIVLMTTGLTNARIPITSNASGGIITDNTNFTYSTTNTRLSPRWISLGAGGTAALSGPIVWTSGPLMTAAESGAMEYLNGQLYISDGTPVRFRMNQQQENIASTVGVSTQDLNLFPVLATGESGMYTCDIVYRNTTSGASGASKLAGLFKNVSGTITLEGASQTLTPLWGDPVLIAGLTNVMKVVGGAATVEITTPAATNLSLKATCGIAKYQ